VWVTEAPVPDPPSPKFQLILYGGVPPAVVAEKVTGRFTNGVLGEIVKLVDNIGGVIEPKNSAIGAALQSVETMHVRPQFCSSVARNE
jgi:hypothetical protein